MTEPGRCPSCGYCPACGPTLQAASGRDGPAKRRKKKHKTPQEAPSATGNWDGIATAVALLTAWRTRSGESLADILGDTEPGPVIATLTMIAGTFVGAIRLADDDVPRISDEGVTDLLRHIGLMALERPGVPPGTLSCAPNRAGLVTAACLAVVNRDARDGVQPPSTGRGAS